MGKLLQLWNATHPALYGDAYICTSEDREGKGKKRTLSLSLRRGLYPISELPEQIRRLEQSLWDWIRIPSTVK